MFGKDFGTERKKEKKERKCFWWVLNRFGEIDVIIGRKAARCNFSQFGPGVLNLVLVIWFGGVFVLCFLIFFSFDKYAVACCCVLLRAWGTSKASAVKVYHTTSYTIHDHHKPFTTITNNNQKKKPKKNQK